MAASAKTGAVICIFRHKAGIVDSSVGAFTLEFAPIVRSLDPNATLKMKDAAKVLTAIPDQLLAERAAL